MDMFWCDIKYVKVDVHWLLKIKDSSWQGWENLVKHQMEEIKKSVREFLTLKNGSWEVWWKPSIFKFKYDFDTFCYSKFPDFDWVSLHPSYNQ